MDDSLMWALAETHGVVPMEADPVVAERVVQWAQTGGPFGCDHAIPQDEFWVAYPWRHIFCRECALHLHQLAGRCAYGCEDPVEDADGVSVYLTAHPVT